MLFHYGSFVTLTILAVFTFALTSRNAGIKNKVHDYDSKLRYLRVNIAGLWLGIPMMLFGAIV